jgi:hypothetical protein
MSVDAGEAEIGVPTPVTQRLECRLHGQLAGGDSGQQGMRIVSVHGGNSRRRSGVTGASREEAAMRRVVSVLLVGLVAAVAVAACGQIGGTQALPSRGPVAVASPSPSPSVSASPSPTASPSAAGFPTDYAVPCAGRPTPDQVIALLRTAKVVPATAVATVTTGPLCSGTWQYTALDVAGLGPLQAVTRGTPPVLELVTAGTDICTPTVKSEAPAGITTLARC